MSKVSLWWIRRDIRLSDNQALAAAIDEADFLIPLFVIEPELMESAAPKRRTFLLQALSDLDQQLQELGSRLVIRQGPAQAALSSLCEALDEVTIFAHEDYSPFARERDGAVEDGLPLRLFPGVTIRHPQDILKADGDPYVVYTPYKNQWYENPLPTPGDCLTAPDRLPPLPPDVTSENLPEIHELADFPATLAEARARLGTFLEEGIYHYKSQRDELYLDGTSQLSPYLKFGLISVREAFTQAQVRFIQAGDGQARKEVRTWMDELVWREFYTAILYHFPRVMQGPFREDYRDISWRDAPEDLQAWQDGQTGYPIVDACMRQLKETGWMHNRGRMIAASFLTKDLLISWQAGEDWFMQNLVDGDPAANNGGWQWSAGTGTDAAPYFRIFNPVLQGQKYDAKGAYIARWVPELRDLPVKFQHESWEMREEEEKSFGFKLGKDYPERIVDHSFARQRTLAAYKSSRG